jgi:hypothetical protein
VRLIVEEYVSRERAYRERAGAMNSIYAMFVANAAEIKTSGRWKAINARIVRMAAKPGPGNAWYVQVFGSLCSQLFAEYIHLEKAYGDQRRDPSLIAWRARTLLELSVWCAYCTESREKAQRFYGDAGRDLFNMFQLFEEWGRLTGQPADWSAPFAMEKQEISRRAAAEGIKTLDGPYMTVSRAMKELGGPFEKFYKVANKTLSKFAHPTAMFVLGTSDEATTANQVDAFFALGCLCFTGGFNALESEALERDAT